MKIRHTVLAALAIGALSVQAPLVASARPVAPPSGSFVLWHETSLPSGTAPVDIVTDSLGRTWFDDIATGEVAMFDPATSATKHFAVTKRVLRNDLVEGPGGHIWFADLSAGTVRDLDPVSGALSTVTSARVHAPFALTPVGDGSYWASTSTSGVVLHLAADGTVTEFSIPGSSFSRQHLAWGGDDRLWITEDGASTIEAFDPLSGAVDTYPTGATHSDDLVAGGDGAVWMEDAADIVRIDPTGTVQRFSLPGSAVTRFPIDMAPTAGSMIVLDDLGRILSVTSDGLMTPVGPSNAGADPQSLAVGPDGSVWYADTRNGTLGNG